MTFSKFHRKIITLVSVLFTLNGFVNVPGGDNIVHCAHTVHDITEEFSHTNCNRKKDVNTKIKISILSLLGTTQDMTRCHYLYYFEIISASRGSLTK